MDIAEKTVTVRDYLTKSSLPASDFVINPYLGCPHGCKYCYACFMKRFHAHQEPWGEFIDIKQCDKPIDLNRLQGKSFFLSSVTDCYNPFEEKYRVTRKILEQLVFADCQISISTKSKLILRDLDLLRQCKNLKVCMSVNTLDEDFKGDMDRADSIADRLETLRRLHEEGICTVLFLSPIFPGLTDCRAIIGQTASYIEEYWFENLNLRGSYRQTILNFIRDKHPQLTELYQSIYTGKDSGYWDALSEEIEAYCGAKGIRYSNYFDHKKLVQEKKDGSGAGRSLGLR